jgi:hypothetical protein
VLDATRIHTLECLGIADKVLLGPKIVRMIFSFD